MIGDLYESSLAGTGAAEIEHADGRRTPLRVEEWMGARPGDDGLLDRCSGPTLDIGSGPGRLTTALGERGIPSLGIDITPYAVALTQAAGGLALCRSIFDRVPGTGRWQTLLLADGNIGIDGDPAALLRRSAELLRRGGLLLVEVEPPGVPSRAEWVRLRTPARTGDWFRWAHLSIDDTGPLAAACGLALADEWTEAGRWFAALTKRTNAVRTGAVRPSDRGGPEPL
ncbi:SAM-dependent methyltransferase [Actinomadura barringtoniae]|uniref:SAM-dependent methyltransferase n=1 Tax=Actinomadura barringtoniae TaxID=1427535 RepID=A0A939PB49_9ACTN|nr:SAM-dependent methyltransferase [Actinomadura barringtoniae]MBO2449345.1 SAM-dependent methyltransferase [Actinomadura barringtoniae]